MKIEMQLPDKLFGLETSLLKIFLWPLVLVVIFLISLSLIIMPKMEKIGVLRKESEVVKGKTKTIALKRDYLLTVDEEELKKKSSFLTEALLKERDAYLLVGIIKQIAGKHGFYVQSFSVSPGEMSSEGDGEVAKTVEKAVDRVPISFMVAGEKDRYLEFILALERSLPILSVDSFDMTRGQQIVKLDLNVSAFYVGEKSEYGMTEIKLADLMLSLEEEALLAELGEYEMVSEAGGGGDKSDFVEYDRTDPFSSR